jgi:hypothetical protein
VVASSVLGYRSFVILDAGIINKSESVRRELGVEVIKPS